MMDTTISGTISYQVPEPGHVVTRILVDTNERLVRYLVKNALLGLNGNCNWVGMNENAQKVLLVTYMVFTEIFNLRGRKQPFKNAVVLPRKPN